MRFHRRPTPFHPPTGEYVADPINATSDRVALWHLNGDAWHDAELPPERHDCWAQTKGDIRGRQLDRCACGASRLDGTGAWMHKNETRQMMAERP